MRREGHLITASDLVPLVLLHVRHQEHRHPLLLSLPLQDPSLEDSTQGDAAGGLGVDVDHPLTERGHVLPGSRLHHVR